MPGNPELEDVMRRIIGNRSQRDIAELAQVSQTLVHDMLRGRRPSYSKAVEVADNLKLEPALRADFFAAVHYGDPRAPEPSRELTYELDPENLEALGLNGIDQLTPSQRDRARRMLQEYIDGIREERGHP